MISSLMLLIKMGALLTALVIYPGLAQSEDDSRAVRIIDGPSAHSAPSCESQPPLVAPSPTTVPGQVPGGPTITTLPQQLKTPSPTLPPTAQGTITVANPADLLIEVLPNRRLSVGSRVSFRVSTKMA